jgi:hypothetical protein
MYKNLVAIRKLLKPIFYPENVTVDSSQMNFWATENGTTGFAMYRKGRDGRDYHILVNGRTPSLNIPCAQHTTIFTNSTNPSFNSSTGYKLSQYSLAVVRS